MVDNTFKQMLIDIVGEEFLDSFRQNNTADYIDMFRAFEKKKKEKYKSLNTRTITISPYILFRKIQRRKWYRYLQKNFGDPIRKIVEMGWR